MLKIAENMDFKQKKIIYLNYFDYEPYILFFTLLN